MMTFYNSDRTILVQHTAGDPTVAPNAYTPARYLETPDNINYTFDAVTEQLALPNTLSDIVTCAYLTARENRDVRQAGTFPFNGTSYDADQGSREKIAAASLLATQAAMMQQPFSIAWTDAANTAHTFDGMQMMQLGQAAAVHVQTEHAIYQAVKAQIDAATTVDEVLAITEALVW